MRKTSDLPNSGADSAEYPFGVVLDETNETPGTPLVEGTYGDVLQSMWHFMTRAGLVPNGLPDNAVNGYQLHKAMEMIFDPVGTVKAWAGGSGNVPDGYMICDGRALVTTDYPELYAVIGMTFGQSGANFRIPNLAGRTIFGPATGMNLGASGGEKEHVLTVNEMPYHKHGVNWSMWKEDGNVANHMANGGSTFENTYFGNETQYTGGDQAHNNMPPYQVLNWIIKVETGALL